MFHQQQTSVECDWYVSLEPIGDMHTLLSRAASPWIAQFLFRRPCSPQALHKPGQILRSSKHNPVFDIRSEASMRRTCSHNVFCEPQLQICRVEILVSKFAFIKSFLPFVLQLERSM